MVGKLLSLPWRLSVCRLAAMPYYWLSGNSWLPRTSWLQSISWLKDMPPSASSRMGPRGFRSAGWLLCPVIGSVETLGCPEPPGMQSMFWLRDMPPSASSRMGPGGARSAAWLPYYWLSGNSWLPGTSWHAVNVLAARDAAISLFQDGP